jgi:tRNA uridine 5-carbamoylmethylation protein Kti12
MKTLILLRGLPGSGKTTLAKSLSNALTGHAEADIYFTDDKGNYNFDASKLKQVHDWCQKETESYMKPFGFDTVIVSNTFTTEKELEPYLKLAKKYDYQVVSLIVENRHGNKSVHNVPEETLLRMKNRFSIKL